MFESRQFARIFLGNFLASKRLQLNLGLEIQHNSVIADSP